MRERLACFVRKSLLFPIEALIYTLCHNFLPITCLDVQQVLLSRRLYSYAAPFTRCFSDWRCRGATNGLGYRPRGSGISPRGGGDFEWPRETGCRKAREQGIFQGDQERSAWQIYRCKLIICVSEHFHWLKNHDCMQERRAYPLGINCFLGSSEKLPETRATEKR